MNTQTLAIPSIHHNGTSKESLLEDICNATYALQEAVSALAQTAPNGRDYYVQNAGAYEIARRQHELRMHKIADVIRELNEIGEAIQ